MHEMERNPRKKAGIMRAMLMAAAVMVMAGVASAADGVVFEGLPGAVRVAIDNPTGTTYTLAYRVTAPTPGTTVTLTVRPPAGVDYEHFFAAPAAPLTVWVRFSRAGGQGEPAVVHLEPGRPVTTLDPARVVLADEFEAVAAATLSGAEVNSLRTIGLKLVRAQVAAEEAARAAEVEKVEKEIEVLARRRAATGN
jgi:hypothetical protein